MSYFAVIDTETNWNNEVMSIGIVIAKADTFEKVDEMYYIFYPEYKVGGMFANVLLMKDVNPKDIILPRENAMEKIIDTFARYKVADLFAYNAAFDKGLLKELSAYSWYDIMRLAAYRQYNDKIPANVECCKTGKMKRHYGVEPMLQMLSGDYNYREVHNALFDSIDELRIMKLLGKSLDEYSVARL